MLRYRSARIQPQSFSHAHRHRNSQQTENRWRFFFTSLLYHRCVCALHQQSLTKYAFGVRAEIATNAYRVSERERDDRWLRVCVCVCKRACFTDYSRRFYRAFALQFIDDKILCDTSHRLCVRLEGEISIFILCLEWQLTFQCNVLHLIFSCCFFTFNSKNCWILSYDWMCMRIHDLVTGPQKQLPICVLFLSVSLNAATIRCIFFRPIAFCFGDESRLYTILFSSIFNTIFALFIA